MWSLHRMFAGVGTHPGRSHPCLANPEFEPFEVSFLKSYRHPGGIKAAPTRVAVLTGTVLGDSGFL